MNLPQRNTIVFAILLGISSSFGLYFYCQAKSNETTLNHVQEKYEKLVLKYSKLCADTSE